MDILNETMRLAPFETRWLDQATRLSGALGWPHRREDWALNLSLGRGVAALQDETLVGTAIASFFGASHATINHVIVDESLRGRGVGRRLMSQALAFCGGREVRLVATPEGRPLYEKLGFAFVGPIAQHQALATVAASSEGARWADVGDFPAISDLDRHATGMDRAPLLRRLSEIGRIAVAPGASAIAGYGVLRESGRGVVVGPVAARDSQTARALIAFLLSQRRGAFLRVDATDADPGLSDWLANIGLPKVDAAAAMRRPAQTSGDAPAPDPTVKIYALASQALG